jgi:16S rRNA (cytosine1402-N4)-methyltransferase
MVDEVAHYLITRRDGFYADLTLGGGGHLKHVSKILSDQAVLVGVDRDPEAVAFAESNLNRLPQKTTFVNCTFDRLEIVMKEMGSRKIDGILMDLGLSSHQVDSAVRGFSYLQDGPLDMRMGADCDKTAEDIINDYSDKELTVLFKKYGEEKRASQAAKVICKARRENRIKTTEQLRKILEPVLSPKYLTASLSRIFQAIRIEVNHEMSQLETVLPQALSLLAAGGRMVVIAYHSLEDRIVKRFFARESKGCICPDDFPVCVCGRKPSLKILTRHVVKPSEDEMNRNSRARSARLRAAEKLS